MNVLFFTDCMSIGPEYFDESFMYPQLIKKKIEEKLGNEVVIEVIPGSGETTIEAVEKLEIIKSAGKDYDFIIFAYGINDGLPRGLKRSTRGKIIRLMYKLKFNEKLRLLARTYFLNPLEFVMQLLRKPLHYNQLDGYVKNVLTILNELKKYSKGKLIYITISPILNYRFVKGNYYLDIYNKKIMEELSHHDISVIDVFKIFSNGDLKDFLSIDEFHYSKLGHEKIAEAVISVL